jgi:Ser-tRNA(Ala) deacylase AlaX
MTPKTNLKFLSDTYLDTDESIFLHYAQDDRGYYAVLDQTIFYPQGGGQPSDVGSIQLGQQMVDIIFVGLIEGQVRHYIEGSILKVDECLGKRCVLRLDKEKRMKHARLHTAGHLIAGLIDGQRGSMRAVKGYHFDEGPYVEFEGEPEGSDTVAFLASLQNKINLMISKESQVYEEQVTFDELKQRCLNAPPNIPADKQLRTITIHSLDPVPCGGTHVKCLSEIGAVNVVKIKKRKGLTKISYRVHDL